MLSIIGWACFILITADYAGFITLPTLVALPLWLGVILNLFRWAVWEGMIKPRINAHLEQRDNVGTHAAQAESLDRRH